jgi:hypothetical protein
VFGIGAWNGAHDFLLDHCELYQFDWYGFDASSSGGAVCHHGAFRDCYAHDMRQQDNVDGFAFGDGHHFTFERCRAVRVYDGFDVKADHTTLRRCYASECRNGGYKLWADDLLLENCMGFNNGGDHVELDWRGTPKTVHLLNCTFAGAETYGIWVENSADTLRMENCLLVLNQNIGLAFEQPGEIHYQGDYNVFHTNNGPRAVSVGYTDEFDLAQVEAGAWTTYSGQDAHSRVSHNPATDLFLSAQDLHLRPDSVALDQGLATGAPAEDYDGEPRPQGAGVDIGAYEG